MNARSSAATAWIESIGWSEKGAAVDEAVAGSEDQPIRKVLSFEFRVSSLRELDFKTTFCEVGEAYSSPHFEVNRQSESQKITVESYPEQSMIMVGLISKNVLWGNCAKGFSSQVRILVPSAEIHDRSKRCFCDKFLVNEVVGRRVGQFLSAVSPC
jgi:hypothetical protein